MDIQEYINQARRVARVGAGAMRTASNNSPELCHMAACFVLASAVQATALSTSTPRDVVLATSLDIVKNLLAEPTPADG